MFVAPVVGVYFLVIKAADRYEPEPNGLLAAMFVWGAVLATLTALIGNAVGEGVLAAVVGVNPGAQALEASTASFVAPFVEESSKGFGLLVLWALSAVWVKEFDGPLDGVIYGGVIGLGFTLTEDVLYVMRAASESGVGGFGATFVLRTVLNGAGHASFTGATGLGVGLAVISRNPLGKIFWPIVGWCGAVTLHGVHNLLCTYRYADGAGLVVKLLVFWGLNFAYFLALIALALRDRSLVERQLQGELGRLLDAREYQITTSAKMLVPLSNWHSLQRGSGGYRACRKKQLELIELAFLKEAKSRGDRSSALDVKERRLRASIAQSNSQGIYFGAPSF